jgi:hypothetical protein
LESDYRLVVDVGLQWLHRLDWLYRFYRLDWLDRFYGLYRFHRLFGLFRRLLRRGLEFDTGLHRWYDGERERNRVCRELVDAG